MKHILMLVAALGLGACASTGTADAKPPRVCDDGSIARGNRPCPPPVVEEEPPPIVQPPVTEPPVTEPETPPEDTTPTTPPDDEVTPPVTDPPPVDTTPVPEEPVDPRIKVVEGADPIASNFNVYDTLKQSWGNGSIAAFNANDVVGAFRFICGAGKLGYFDPIVMPGVVGKTHLHQFYGATSINANSDFHQLRTTGDSTCNDTGNDTAANRSAYWLPAMLDGKGHAVLPDYTQVYYKREDNLPGSRCDPANPNGVAKWGGFCGVIPNGLKLIVGFDQLTGQINTVNKPNYKCVLNNRLTGGPWVNMVEVNLTTCPVGSHLEVTQVSPPCWSGELDSPNHRDHLVAMLRDRNTGQTYCDKAHPYYIAKVTFSSFYPVREGDDPGLWSLSSDHMFPNLPRGSTLHFDYFEAWDVAVKDMWAGNCIAKRLNCSGGDLGNGLQLKGASVPTYVIDGVRKTSWINPDHLVDLASIPTS